MIRFSCFLLILIYTHISFSQNILMEGVIKNHSGEGILGVNMLAKPLEEGNKTAFTFTDFNGRYKMQLRKDVAYSLSITYLGYATITDSIQLSKDTNKDFILEQDIGQLNEVIINAKIAVLIRKDTITYRPESFVTGNERKLRDILDKLPGVEVDKDGNVTVQGKSVTDLLVDGKPFFGGETQLGVNSIPADAIEELEVIDDYHEVSFMKDLQPSQRMAMNIKLKEGKKKLLFGDIEAGGGKDEKYYLQSGLFYYSPETTLNFIGSLNNVNKSPMTRSDVNRFRRGASSFSSNNPVNNLDQGLSQFSSSSNLTQKKIGFGGINMSHQLNKNLELNAYSIVNYQNSDALTTSEISYLLKDNLFENRKNNRNTRSLSNLNNIKLNYKPNHSTDIAHNILLSYADAKSIQDLYTSYNTEDKHIYSQQTPDNIELSQVFRWSSQPRYKHTFEVNANHSFKRGSSPTDWIFDKPLFSNIIPSIDEGGSYNFLQNMSLNSQVGSAEFKHFWVLNNTNHIYPFIGLHFIDQSFKSIDYQLLQDGSENSFDSANFNNDLDFRLLNPYIGFQYKIMIGRILLRPGLVYNYYSWRVRQFDDKLVDKSKGILLPELNIEYKTDTNITLELDYSLESSFKEATEYANRYRLESFNQLYKGNENLENEQYHQARLSLRTFSMLNNTHANIGLFYNKRRKSVRKTTILEGIDQISTSIYSDLPENNYSIFGSFSKNWWRTLTLATSINSSFYDYSRIINAEQIDYKNKNFGYSIQTSFKKKNYPYLKLIWKQSFSNSESNTYKSNYIITEPSAEFEYNFLRDFVFKADYAFTYSKQKQNKQKETYEMSNASLEFKRPNSLLGFEIRIENIFNIKYKRFHNTDQFMIYDQYVYIHPRTALFIVSFKINFQ